MTDTEFLTFYPQFTAFPPAAVRQAFVQAAAARFASFGADAEEARRLFTAHKLSLYAKSYPATGSSASASDLSLSGASNRITGHKAGEVSVSYTSGSSASTSGAFSDLSGTEYGLQLLSLLHLHGWPQYIP